MDSFVVSARKYRPQTFKSVVGQFNITQTLRSAVKNRQLAHAYLFCGPRGVGKTTCARIFAKAINCFTLTQDNEPCNNCESCHAFNNNRSYNIHELDAASNNSVDDIRSLIEQVRITPRLGTHNVYIIDEVHMLSQSAFNAFLKTLEEPPPHAIFVLATTERHKILPTILSRCQVFDFSRIRIEDTINHLAYVAQNEGIKTEDAALRIIAQKSDGGMRDALSIFDQLVSFTGGELTYQNTIENLNILDCEFYFQTVDNILTSNIAGIMLIIDDILSKGFDGLTFLTGLSLHFRDLLMSKNPKTVRLIDAGEEMEKRYMQQSAQCSTGLLFTALQKLRECELNYKLSKNQRLHLELTLMDIGFFQFNIENKKKNPSIDNKKTKNIVSHKSVQLPPRPQSQVSIRSALVDNPISPDNCGASNSANSLSIGSPMPDRKPVSDISGGNIEELINVWHSVIALIEERPRLHVALKNSKPFAKPPSTLVLTLNSETQIDLINESLPSIKQAILQYCQLQDINFEFIIDSDANDAAPTQTVDSLISAFTEKNPALQKLIDSFDMQLIK